MQATTSLFILNFLLLLSVVSSWSVKVQNQPTAGGTAEVEWQRISNDSIYFALSLRTPTGSPIGGYTEMKLSHNNPPSSGTMNVPVKDPGTYMIEVYESEYIIPSLPPYYHEGPKAESPLFQVDAASQQAPNSPTATTAANLPSTPTTSTSNGNPGDQASTDTDKIPTASPSESSRSDGTASSSQTLATDTQSVKTMTNVPSSTETAFTTTLNGLVLTITGATVLTFISNSQTLETSINPPIPTSFEGSQTVGTAKKSDIGVIVGAVIGSLLFLLIFALLLLFYRRRRRRQATSAFFRDRMVRNGSSQALTQNIDEKSQDFKSKPFDTELSPYDGVDDISATSALTAAPKYPAMPLTPPTTLDSTHFFVQRKPPPSMDSTNLRSLAPSPPPKSSSLGLLPPRTERQMEIHDRIVQLQAKRLGLQNWASSKRSSTGSGTSELSGKESGESIELERKIRDLEGLMQSPWALGRTDAVPKEMLNQS